MMITLLKSTSILTKYSPRLLVGPPTGCGYYSRMNHELKRHDFNIKMKNAVLHSFSKICLKMEKHS